ncbi:MAG: FN3 domain-containing metallophosphoesterase family protein [Bacteroidia bacterium]|nr:FN3 domain-containing metallophosphoesterase family protein [Bacteroidia bacterium]
MKKTTSSALLIIVLILCGISGCQSQTNQQPFTLTCTPYLQNLHQNGITIMWMVNNNATSWVEYGKTEQRGSKAVHTQSGMVDVNPGVQKIVLTGLEPGTRYFYRVASNEVKLLQAYKVIFGDTLFSETYSFTTPSASTRQFSFLAFNDLHSKPQFVNDIVKRENGFSFAMLNGDIMGDINTEDEIAKCMLIPFSNYFATGKPFFLTRGNHETRGSGARSLLKYIDTPSGKYYYSFTYGIACFIVLDCGEDKPDEHPAYFGLADYDNYRIDEAEWLSLEVQKPAFKNAEYKIVCIHMPITLQPQGEDKIGNGPADCSAKFAPILNKAGVDLLLAGHTHQFAVIHPQKGVTNFPVIVGGAPVSGNDQTKTTYTLVEVGKSGITCFLKKVNGDVIEEVKIKK